MANLFQKAAAKASVEAATPKADIPAITPDDPKVMQAIDQFNEAKRTIKEAESKKKTAKAVADGWAKTYFLKLFASTGRKPETFWVAGAKTRAQFIAQDRAGVNDFGNENYELLKTLVGEKRAEAMVLEFTQFSLNDEILNMPGVVDKLSAAIESIPDDILSPAQKEALLVPAARRLIRDGVIDDLPKICDGDAEKMALVVDALGSNLTVYLK